MKTYAFYSKLPFYAQKLFDMMSSLKLPYSFTTAVSSTSAAASPSNFPFFTCNTTKTQVVKQASSSISRNCLFSQIAAYHQQAIHCIWHAITTRKVIITNSFVAIAAHLHINILKRKARERKSRSTKSKVHPT